MERYYKRKAQDTFDANGMLCPNEIKWIKRLNMRKEIDAYHPNLREKVRKNTWRMDKRCFLLVDGVLVIKL